MTGSEISMRLKKQVCRHRSKSQRRVPSEVLNGYKISEMVLVLIMTPSRCGHRNGQVKKSVEPSISKDSTEKQNL